MESDTSEKGLEGLIVASMTGAYRGSGSHADRISETPAGYGLNGWVAGDSKDYDREYAVDLVKLLGFLKATQPEALKQLNLGDDGPKRRQFLARLQGEIAKRGVVDVLRKGLKHGAVSVDLFYGTPTPGNPKAKLLFASNIFSVTRQLHYSQDETKLALDLCLFINGLPIITFELKNSLTKQTVHDAIQQYKRDRDPKDLLFQFGRCMVHFAVDDLQVWMCTHLKGKESWFLPFNKGWNDGAGNPPNPGGIATDYLWKEVLRRESLTNIIENYAQIIEEKDEKTGRKKRKQVFPRYHQLDVVKKLLADAAEKGPGERYLIQHSAGSGKSNSITWLAHQLVELKRGDAPVFDSVIVVTDRRVLDKQIRDNIRRFAHVSVVVGAVTEGAQQLRKYIQQGKKIIISTVQKFPRILDEIGNKHRDRKFAIIIDEAHSSQGGRTAAKMHMVLAQKGKEDQETTEDIINRIIETRKMLSNSSYFAFTATPKNRTLELFGIKYHDGEKEQHKPFHKYTMMQAIQEGFILDVLQNYTPVNSYYHLIKKIEDDPEFDTRKAQKKLRLYVENHEDAIRQKAEIMVDHFHDHVKSKISGEARAIIVTSSILRAIEYFHAFQAYLKERKSPYKAIVAFTGKPEYKGKKVTEASLNGFPSSRIPEKIQENPYRFLIAAEKFQTGYDEPLLHTMYVDKVLSGIKAVQTLSRLNRAHPKKYDTFVLDFYNDAETIQKAFQDYYRTTILSGATDPNKLHDLKARLDERQVYAWNDVENFVGLYLHGADRAKLDPILDTCRGNYLTDLDEDGQVEFKGAAKTYVRTYSFLASILPFNNVEWEKLSVFLNFLVPKLPAPPEPDLSRGILEAIDMDSYRVETQAQMRITLEDKDAEIEPTPTGGSGFKPEPEPDKLSNIIRSFNELYGNIEWKDADKIRKVITEEIPGKVASDKAYQNAQKQDDKQNARIEHDKALQRVMVALLSDQTELFKQFSDNSDFRRWLGNTIFNLTYKPKGNDDTDDPGPRLRPRPAK